jgi:prepilin-type N-terminal cleavage/methylation domain-containing protein
MKRRGYALVELMVVIGVAGVLLGITSGLAALLLGIEHNSRESLRRQVTAAGLARQFRRDVRSGTQVLPPDGKAQPAAGWRIKTAEGSVIEYRVQGASLVRSVTDRGAVGEQAAYELPADARVGIEVSAAGRPALVSLSITTPRGKPVRGVPCVLRVDACLGADREVRP